MEIKQTSSNKSWGVLNITFSHRVHGEHTLNMKDYVPVEVYPDYFHINPKRWSAGGHVYYVGIKGVSDLEVGSHELVRGDERLFAHLEFDKVEGDKFAEGVFILERGGKYPKGKFSLKEGDLSAEGDFDIKEIKD
ncbi:MAG: hypothetical protein ACRESJ_13295 [Pseudomonas sp.]|uniref:hypothetical protein n=1 Tax=Pseudomonas sp. TaxID=306 RepID=UPI003D6FCCB9